MPRLEDTADFFPVLGDIFVFLLLTALLFMVARPAPVAAADILDVKVFPPIVFYVRKLGSARLLLGFFYDLVIGSDSCF